MKHVGTECQFQAYVLTCNDGMVSNQISDGGCSHRPLTFLTASLYSLTVIYIELDFQRCMTIFLHSLDTLSTFILLKSHYHNTSNTMYLRTASVLLLPLLVRHVVGQTQCPSVWGTVAADLNGIFSGTDGCTDDARAAIRLPFHDCFPGACDGSIILSDECTTRGENSQLVDICSTLGAKATEYNVSTADMIQVAGGRIHIGPTQTVSAMG